MRRAQFSLFTVYQDLSVQKLARSFGNFLKLYHQSLSALVQGYREVTMDAENKFRFEESNETVKDRLDRFENRLHQSVTGKSRKD